MICPQGGNIDPIIFGIHMWVDNISEKTVSRNIEGQRLLSEGLMFEGKINNKIALFYMDT